MTTRLLFIHALSPLHAGTGQGSGVIDLPIAREKATGLPYLPGSSLKGVLRDQFPKGELRNALFGPETEHASDHAGSLQIADARVLLLPVRSVRGTFAWVTSPYVLRRFAREAQDAGASRETTPDDDGLPPVPSRTDDTRCLTTGNALTVRVQDVTKVVLEDLDLIAEPNEELKRWANWLGTRAFKDDTEWNTMLQAQLCLVSDNVLNFLLTTAIEVIARIRMNPDSKTVDEGALWYEEALPAETVLSGLAVASPVANVGKNANDIFSAIEPKLKGSLQLGGKATVGRGLCRVRIS